ncbi:MAG TPA: hypothetical protein VFX33_11835 [Actinomycetales bacterium]|nr:hypothetical protein [Actinomycetales bacterium]
MRSLLRLRRRSAGEGPWFRGRPLAAILVAVGLFAAVFALRLLTNNPADVVSTLYTLPIALLAVTFGLRGGLLSGVVGVVLVIVWAVLRDIDISPLGWAARCLPLLLLGALLGQASDRIVDSENERLALQRAAERHRDAVEINDTIVQGMSAAKWSLEAGNIDRGIETLSDTLRLAHELVSDLLRQADMGPSANGTGRAAGKASDSLPR